MNEPKTTIDWFRFRTKGKPEEILEALRPLFGDGGPVLVLARNDRGQHGFERSVGVYLGDIPVARIDFGGVHQREWHRVDMGGKGCGWATRWDALQAVQALPLCELRRVDIALTTWDGEVTHEMLIAAHAKGRFGCGGRPPELRQITSSDPRAGRTGYIGGRKESDKMLRGYEKGFELISRFPKEVADKMTHIDGKRIEDIYRVEIELKSATRPIPWEVIERRDQYFAGSYPFCADILPGIEADILQRCPDREPLLDMQALVAHCKASYGKTLYTVLEYLEGDLGALVNLIIGEDHNMDLVRAGVLMIEPEGLSLTDRVARQKALKVQTVPA